jgi:pullulanase/glycogen debranching enzyme
MIIDGVSYWTCDIHADGFRFDLATIFTRDEDGRVNLDDPPPSFQRSAVLRILPLFVLSQRLGIR